MQEWKIDTNGLGVEQTANFPSEGGLPLELEHLWGLQTTYRGKRGAETSTVDVPARTSDSLLIEI